MVSRQMFAFFSAIGLPELAAQDADDYLRIAVKLAADRARLAALRNPMRARMQASPLMDVTGFTRQLEQCLMDLCRGNSLTLAGKDGSPRPAASR
jgi:predicted O-linked N-acetylglucosamine transferase (SPINDLY family)